MATGGTSGWRSQNPYRFRGTPAENQWPDCYTYCYVKSGSQG